MYMKTILTGDRPTGTLHLGHYVGSIVQRLKYQQTDNLFVIVADTQVLNNDPTKGKLVSSNIVEVMKDYIACGLDPNKVTFFQQSKVLELFELYTYFSNIVSLSSILRIPTIKSEQELYGSSNMGFLNYPISQTADIVMFGTDIVPVGIDQAPVVEFANDLIQKFNHLYSSETFKKVKPELSACPKLVGIDGNTKMSKSLGNAILLSDSKDQIKKKVRSMYTDSGHLRVSDPGKVEGNVVFSFLDVFHDSPEELQELKSHYMRGGLGDSTIKQILEQKINNVLEPIRNTRESLSNSDMLDILSTGTAKCKSIAASKMEEVRAVIFG